MLLQQPLPPPAPRPLIGLRSATLLVVANMIGAGVFAITGDLARTIPSASALLLAWVVGGLMALCGALSYGELAARLPRSGGEYHFLSRLYHPALGFVSGFVSLVVGFAASIAANATAFGIYVATLVPGLDPVVAALGLLTALSLLHAFNARFGVAFQDVFAVLKVALILIFIVAGLFVFDPAAAGVGALRVLPTAADWDFVFNGAYALALISIYYAYLGWNASVYLAGEVRQSERNVPLSLMLGTLAVLVLYLLLNYVFLRSVPLETLTGKVEIGALAAEAIFGRTVGGVLSGLIAFALVSSTSSMILIGPRVTAAMGEDFPVYRLFARRTSQGGPKYALLAQWLIAGLLIATASFGQILQYIGFTLGLFSALTVLGVYVLRHREGPPTGLRAWGYPITPALFILLCLWMVVQSLVSNPWTSVAGLATMALGLVVYRLSWRAA